jgi:hypothetical protein
MGSRRAAAPWLVWSLSCSASVFIACGSAKPPQHAAANSAQRVDEQRSDEQHSDEQHSETTGGEETTLPRVSESMDLGSQRNSREGAASRAPAGESSEVRTGDVARSSTSGAETGQASAAHPANQDPETEPRKILYRSTPEGLIIEVAGARFRPQATPVKLSNGGYAIELRVTAEATDGKSHGLLSPENGTLALAATLFDKHGKQLAHHVDERRGEDHEFLTPSAELVLSRRWPSGSVKGPLFWGQRVKLFVGLWGLSASDEGEGRTRPVRKLFVVEMVGGAKPVAVITPPDVD